MNFEIDWIAIGFSVVGQTVILTVALWIMLKIQAFDWSTPGLIGAVALACILDHVPYIGWELSGIVLLFCVKKLIHSRTFTDALFSVVVAYAITFAVNMFLLTALVGDLTHQVKVRARMPEHSPSATTQPVDSTNASPIPRSTRTQWNAAQSDPATVPDATPAEATVSIPTASPTPAPTVARTSPSATHPANASPTPAVTASTPTAPPAPSAPVAPAPTAPAVNAAPVVATSQSAPQPAPVEPVPAGPNSDTNRLENLRLAGDVMKHYYVKGVSQGATISIAMISNGTRNFDIVAGDVVQLETSDGKFVAVKCESVGDGQVTVSVDGVKVTLFHR